MASKEAVIREVDGPAEGSSSTPIISISSSPYDMFAVFDACGADIIVGNASLLAPSSGLSGKSQGPAGAETSIISLSDEALFFPALFLDLY